MKTPGQNFFSSPLVRPFTLQDILDGSIIKINPALITLTDGFVDKLPAADLQQQVMEQVNQLLAHKIRTFHVDVNFEDYRGFGMSGPEINQAVFDPQFLQMLNQLVQPRGAYLNLHLLTDFPLVQIAEYSKVGAGAICFQLDSIADHKMLVEVIEYIQHLGACASPVIETVGSENRRPRTKEAVRAFLGPVLSQIGMLTFQVAGTAARSNIPTGQFAVEQARSYISHLKQAFGGTIQLQGGITTQTIAEAVRLGAEFIVCGSEIFRNRTGRPAAAVIDHLLQRAAEGLSAA